MPQITGDTYHCRVMFRRLKQACARPEKAKSQRLAHFGPRGLAANPFRNRWEDATVHDQDSVKGSSESLRKGAGHAQRCDKFGAMIRTTSQPSKQRKTIMAQLPRCRHEAASAGSAAWRSQTRSNTRRLGDIDPSQAQDNIEASGIQMILLSCPLRDGRSLVF